MLATTSHCDNRATHGLPNEFVLVGRSSPANGLAGPFVVSVDGSPVFGATAHAEDPFLFRNRYGFHVIAHGTDLYDINSGRHAWNADGVRWSTSAVPAYGPLVQHPDPARSTVLAHRERPKLVLDGLGQPTHLVNGVQRVEDLLGTGSSHTLVQPLC